MSFGVFPGMCRRAERAGPLVVRLRPLVGKRRFRNSVRRRRLRERRRRNRSLAPTSRDLPQAKPRPNPAIGAGMADLAKIPVTVITGFLGSGKTTLIRLLMRNPGGQRLAILVN